MEQPLPLRPQILHLGKSGDGFDQLIKPLTRQSRDWHRRDISAERLQLDAFCEKRMLNLRLSRTRCKRS